MKMWACKIGIKEDVQLPGGADAPLREAVKRAFKELTGKDCDFCFSGWGYTLDELERKVVDEKPRYVA